MKAGVYVVKNKSSEQTYVVSLNGISPFIRISNAIAIQEFVNGKCERNHEVIQQIINSPNNFDFRELTNHVERPEESIVPSLEYTDEEYNKFTAANYIRADRNLDVGLVTAEIQATKHVDWDTASKIFVLVNNRYQFDTKWMVSTTEFTPEEP